MRAVNNEPCGEGDETGAECGRRGVAVASVRGGRGLRWQQ